MSVDSFDFMAAMLPPGMKIQAMYMGIFEDLRSIMGFESMAFKSIEEPELLGDILEQLTILAVEAIDNQGNTDRIDFQVTVECPAGQAICDGVCIDDYIDAC